MASQVYALTSGKRQYWPCALDRQPVHPICPLDPPADTTTLPFSFSHSFSLSLPHPPPPSPPSPPLPPGSWPHVSSSFGQFTLDGIPKAHAYWYRAWWLCTVAASDAGRPYIDSGCDDVRIAETWDGQSPPDTVHVFSSLPHVELFVNGKSVGKASVSHLGYASFKVKYAAGNVSAVATSGDGKTAVTHTRQTPGAAASLGATLDVPNVNTGTGTAVVADGHDAALIRVTVLDAQQRRVSASNASVAFRVKSGPGRILGVGNGDPMSHEPNQAHSHAAFHGYVHAVVRVTLDCTNDDSGPRDVDVETAFVQRARGACAGAIPDIVVEASAEGLGTAEVSVPVSADAAAHGVLAIAAGRPSPDALLKHFDAV